MPNWRTSPEAVVERRLITMGPPIIFRPLETNDGPLLADFYATLSPRDSTYFRPHELDGENAFRVAAEAEADTVITIVAAQMCDECGQTLLLGYIYIREQGAGEPWTLGVCVRPGYRSHGIGRTLFERIFACAQVAGVPRICLTVHQVNLRARHLYESMGFVITGEFHNQRDQLMQFHMVKEM